jgi:hypothetical protein
VIDAAFRRWRDETGDVTGLALVRIALGLLLLHGAVRAARELTAGYFGDVFHWPMLPEALVPSRAVYGVAIAVLALLAVLVVVGVRAREALLASASLGTYLLSCDRLQFHHNRWALLCMALLVSMTPCDRALCVGAAPASPVGPLWAVRLAQLQVSLVYAASGGSKLLDADWRGGQVLLERFRLYGAQALDAGVPAGVLAWLSHPDVTGTLAKLAIATELFLAVGLWMRRTRWAALAAGIAFHGIIEVTARVEGFSWLMLASYGLFFLPELAAVLARFGRHAAPSIK